MAGVPTHSEMLADVPFFALLDDQERAALADRLDVVTFAAGHCIFNRGDPGETLYIVRKGIVEMWFKNDTGERLVVETARVGDFFGEISLLDGGPRTTSALVTEDLEALVVDRGDLDEFLHTRPAAALDFLAATGRRLRETTNLLAHAASRDINEESDKRTRVMKIADWISDFSGSLRFLFIHLGLFFTWIVLNVKPLSASRLGGFDPYPFGLLTMVVSLEAIILSVFVLLSQNRQVARDRVRNDIEYSVNLKAELEIAHLHEKFDQMNVDVLARLDALQKRIPDRAA
jgi:CRP/FNR family transcriptional regulator, cyclic AMP receptor protein